MIPHGMSCKTLYTEISGHEYVLPELNIEVAVREYIERHSLFAPLPLGAEWDFEWDEDAKTLTVTHTKATRKESE